MQKIKVTCIMPNRFWTVGEIRLTEPLKKVCQNHSEIECHFVAIFDLTSEDLENTNIVILQRIASPFIERVTKKLVEKQIPYIYEIDDLLWDMPKELLSASAWNRNKERLFFLLRNAFAITTSTQNIADKLYQFNSNIHIIPNVLSNSSIPTRRFNSNAKLILSATDRMYIDSIFGALKRLQKIYSTEIIAIGPVAKDLTRKGIVVKEIPIMGLDEYSEFLASCENIIGLCPLDDSVFSQCKSFVKYQSYALAGIPVIASNRRPYSSVITHGENGYLVFEDSEDSWFEAIQLHLKKTELLDRYIKNASSIFSNMIEPAFLWYKLLTETYKKCPSQIHAFKIPASWSWKHLRYLFSVEKYIALFRLIRQYGIKKIFHLLRKGM